MLRRYICCLVTLAALLLMGLTGCSSSNAASNTSAPFKVKSTEVQECLDGLFEMEIPDGMSSDGVESFSDDDLCESFYPDEGGTSSKIFISMQEISPYLGADKFASEYFDSPPSDATYKYKNIKVMDLPGGHYISSAEVYEEGAEDSNKTEICFSLDENRIVTIAIENIQKIYSNTVASTIKIL